MLENILMYIYTCDVSQVARPLLSAGDWNLSIENSSLADDGLYECQVNTEPKINYKVFLSVQGQ